MAAPGDPVWRLSSTKPPRVYVAHARYTVLLDSIGSLAQDGIELAPCTTCREKAQELALAESEKEA
jgi:hypothetical protein